MSIAHFSISVCTGCVSVFVGVYYYYFTYQYRYIQKNYESKREKSNEEGTLELIQWPSGLYPFADRGLTGSWTDQLNQLINQ